MDISNGMGMSYGESTMSCHGEGCFCLSCGRADGVRVVMDVSASQADHARASARLIPQILPMYLSATCANA